MPAVSAWLESNRMISMTNLTVKFDWECLTLIEENSGKGYIQEKVEENLNNILYGTQIEGGSRDGLLKNKPVLHPSKSKVRSTLETLSYDFRLK